MSLHPLFLKKPITAILTEVAVQAGVMAEAMVLVIRVTVTVVEVEVVVVAGEGVAVEPVTNLEK
ncbi:MAG: hypothetical protein KKH60_00020 [Proteobacteria bacterium]|nr:hypothetical protein [Pseudomonadota bacterium]